MQNASLGGAVRESLLSQRTLAPSSGHVQQRRQGGRGSGQDLRLPARRAGGQVQPETLHTGPSRRQGMDSDLDAPRSFISSASACM